MVPGNEREGAYGRALGRVLAHELYHIFGNTTHHASEGVAKESYTVQDLLTEEFQFEAKESPPAAYRPAPFAPRSAHCNSLGGKGL